MIHAVPILLSLALTAERCPVQTNKEAEPEHSVIYQGRKIEFCCESCKEDFLADPAAYLHNLPPAETSTRTALKTPDTRTISDKVVDAIMSRWMIALAIALGVLGIGARWASSRVSGAGSAAARSILRAIGSVFFVVAAFEGVLIYALRGELDETKDELGRMNTRLYEQSLIETVHGPTFAEFGYPPIPARPKLPSTLEDTYYRGNDERTPKLFNNGYYRTSTFHIRVDGVPADRFVGGKELAVRWEIVRAKHTADFFFSDKVMNRVYLTKDADKLQGYRAPVADRVGLTVLEPKQRWVASYPLGRMPETGAHVIHGIIYACEERYDAGRLLGGRFHYGIEYELHVEDGRLTDESALWMGALYRSRDRPFWSLPLEEWFSHDPIPEIPAPQTTDDPSALGIDRYEDKPLDH
jgi:YHS domain-containing protein